jgi:ribosomal-protein-alanine N-acetyltransferase
MELTLFPTLETERLLLRQIKEEDIQNIYTGLSNPEVIKYYGVSFDSLKATEEQLIWFKNLEETETGIWWGICSKDNKMFYGAGGFNGISKEHKKAEIGFWLLPEFWGMGLMQEAFPIICSYGFTHLKLNRIEGFVNSENQNCKKAIEKMNFKIEGTMRECEFKNGRYLNVDIYSKLQND